MFPPSLLTGGNFPHKQWSSAPDGAKPSRPADAHPVAPLGRFRCGHPTQPECPMQISTQPRRSLIGEAIAFAMMLAPLTALIGWAA